MTEMNWLEKPIVNSKAWNWIYKRWIYSKFIEFIGDELNGNVLEIGCGIGKTTHFLAEKYKKLKITAIDYDKGQIELANKNKKSKNIEFKQGDATNLKFKNNSFDYVIETNVFHHIEEYDKAIKEVHRVLKNNGRVYLMDISKYFFGPFGKFFLEAAFDKEEFIKNLKTNGFQVEKSDGKLFFFVHAKKV